MLLDQFHDKQWTSPSSDKVGELSAYLLLSANKFELSFFLLAILNP